MKYLLFCILPVFLFTVPALGQNRIFVPGGYELLADQTFPPQLLSARSVVFVSDRSSTNWRDLAAQAHTALRQMGIDGVAYYNMDEVFSGTDPERAFAEKISARQIENLVMVRRYQKEGEGWRYQVVLTPFAGEGKYMENGQKAWMDEDAELKALMNRLRVTLGNSSLKLANHLILEVPEYYGAEEVIAGRRVEDFTIDMSLERLAVPAFMPGEDGLTAEEAKQRNEELAAILENYPYEFSIMELQGKEEKKIRLEGYQFILRRLEAPAITVREMLAYAHSPADTGYVSRTHRGPEISQVITPPREQVHKFYIKHIYTGDVYLGPEWDAATDWQQSLRNFLNNLTFRLVKE